MAETLPPATTQQLVQTLADYVASRCSVTGRGVSGAELANYLRRAFPHFEFAHVGLQRLADAVEHAETQGLLRRRRDVGHLEVTPGEASGRPAQEQVVCVQPGEVPRSQYVRPEFWRAFVFLNQRDRSFLDRSSGRLVSVAGEDTSGIKRYEDDPRYAAIAPIQGDLQKTWMRDFLSRNPTIDASLAPTEDDHWWARFPEWLRGCSPSLEAAWRRYRNEQVGAYLSGWASTNSVQLRLLLVPGRPRGLELVPHSGAGADVRRRAIIAAVSEMRLEELENLVIPMRYVLRHFEAR